MARNNVMMVSAALFAAAVLLNAALLTHALPVQQDHHDDAPAATTEQAEHNDVMLGDEGYEDMASLILSFWGSELHGLDGVDGLVDGHARKRRDVVFRPLWVSRERHANRQRLQQRYWAELRRSQRVGRDTEDAEARRQEVRGGSRPLLPEAERALPRARRAAAPLSESTLMEATGQQRLSRVRRQWAFKPLFVAREAQARYRRLRRALDDIMENVEAPVNSRRRREFVDVPLFAVKQIEAERHREEVEITHPRHHAGGLSEQQYRAEQREEQREEQAEEAAAREAAREYRNYRGNFRGNYRDYYRYYG